MRTLETHVVEGNTSSDLKIEVDERMGPGGAAHHYEITGFDTQNNTFSISLAGFASHFTRLPVIFQDGPVPEKGCNGITIEALLAICIDRLEGFQSGDYPCEENAKAIEGMEMALESLKSRTRARIARNVEGKMVR